MHVEELKGRQAKKGRSNKKAGTAPNKDSETVSLEVRKLEKLTAGVAQHDLE